MTLALAATWNPRGELARLVRSLPKLAQVYTTLAIVLPPHADPVLVGELSSASVRISAVISPDWPAGRYLSLQKALEAPGDWIQYADMDRLLRWVEIQPAEWITTARAIEASDMVVIGRTPRAYATHPQSLIQTEAISNRLVSHLLGRPMDVSAGSKGFSRRAAEFILANSQPIRAIGADGEWPVLAQRGGFGVNYLEVNGLDWESADRYRDRAADAELQRQAAADDDADPSRWARRVEIANEIIAAALDALTRPLI